MKSLFNIFNKNSSKNTSSSSVENSNKQETTSIEIIQQYKNEINEIKIENQPFRLSGLLHILTNKVAQLIKDNEHMIYYDVEKEVGRYIVGDNEYIEQILERLLKDALLLNKTSEVILKISKHNNTFIVFDIVNEKGFIDKKIFQEYTDVRQILSSQSQDINTFAKIKIIAESMHGTITLENSKKTGTHYIFKIPYYEDQNDKNHQEELKRVLDNKKALFIGKDKYDTQRKQYIFETYGIHIENIKLSDFENKKPNLNKYDMAIIRSSDLSYKHINFFKTMHQDKNSNFKIIIVHELFEDEEKINLTKSIADAELYNPAIIGDVEEILHQIFILKSKAVKGINNIEIFNSKEFIIKGNNQFGDHYLDRYRGAHIAIVEDSKVDEKILQNILMTEGIRLFCMHNGAEMIELLENEEIDIIFSDINMPIMDGIVMTKKIRLMSKWEKIPIISISSMAFPHELKKMELAGMNAAISKPIEVQDVYMALENFLTMTDTIRMRENHENNEHDENHITFSFNKEILDVEQGLNNANSNLEYMENLLKTFDYLKHTLASFENMIYNQEFVALNEYSRNTLILCEGIYAPKMINMFKDLNIFLLQKQRRYIADYIPIFKKNLKALEKEIDNYINDV